MKVAAADMGSASTIAVGPRVRLERDAAEPARAARRRLVENPADVCARVVTGSLFLVLAWRLGGDFARTGRLTDLLLLIGEGLVVVLTVLRRHAIAVDRRVVVRLATAASMMSPLLVRPGAGVGLVPEAASAGIAAVGLSIAIAGKLSLGYSFGLLPANRGLVDAGIYRLVRHPIYLGYLLTHLPFLLANPTLWNVIVLVAGDLALIARAAYEEQTLARDPGYVRYARRVRWRLMPGLY